METGLIGQMTGVFNSIFTWLSGALNTVLDIFYDGTTEKLTILGILAIVSLGIAVFMLVLRLISDFFHLGR